MRGRRWFIVSGLLLCSAVAVASRAENEAQPAAVPPAAVSKEAAPPPSAWYRWFQLAAGGSQTSILIAGLTVIWTRQKATGTGVIRPGGVKPPAVMEVAAMDVTSGKARLESLVQLSASAGAGTPAINAASAAAKPQSCESLARLVIRFLLCRAVSQKVRNLISRV